MLNDDILKLRALEPTDLDILYQWENDTELWCVGEAIAPFSRKQLWDYIENYDGDIFSAKQLRFMVVEMVSGIQVGAIDIFDFDPINNRAQIGLLIDKKYSGKGYAMRAMAILENYCRKCLSLYQLIVVIPVDNIKCLSLFGKLNYENTGTFKSWLRRGDEYVDALIFQKKLSI